MTLEGLLFFPVTPFDASGAVDVALLRDHIDERIADGAACVFAGCGTGEFNSLRADELVVVAQAAVEASAGRVPVFVGLGGSAATSRATVTAIESAGAQGLLLLPPYLVSGPQSGLVDYVRAVAGLTALDVIVYQRGDMVFSAESVVELASIPNVIGLKDGVGDLAKMQGIVSAVRASGNADFQFFNGMPTAEISMRAYRAIGVSLYSSAVFAFAPDVAMAFFAAFDGGDDVEVERLLTEFYLPFAAIRDRQLGYHVSLVKAAVSIAGRPAGPVRPPFTDPVVADLDDLRSLVSHARAELATGSADLRPEPLAQLAG